MFDILIVRKFYGFFVYTSTDVDSMSHSLFTKNRLWLSSLTAMCRTCNPEVTQRRRFDSAPGHCRVTTLGKLFTHMCLCHQAVEFGTGFTAGT